MMKLPIELHSLRTLGAACGILLILATAADGVAQSDAQDSVLPKPSTASISAPPTSANLGVSATGAPISRFAPVSPANLKTTAASTSQPGAVGAASSRAAVSATGAPIASYRLPSTLPNSGSVDREEASGQPDGAKGDGSLQQGIKVHGHWVINVKNPDGTLVEHREFENALYSAGPFYLAGLLSGFVVPGDYMITLGANSGSGPCTATYEFCGLVRSLSTYPGAGYCNVYYCATGLTTTFNLSGTGSPAYSIVLNGSMTVNNTGTIGIVYTLMNTCANIAFSANTVPSTSATMTPGSCVNNTTTDWYGPLTSTYLTTPIAVTSGQLVQVIVTISFS